MTELKEFAERLKEEIREIQIKKKLPISEWWESECISGAEIDGIMEKLLKEFEEKKE